MTSIDPKPEIAINQIGQPGDTVSDALNGFINGATSALSGEVCLDIASAYFNVGGYSLLHDALNKVSKVRLLLGAEPTDTNKPRVLTGVKKESVLPESAEQVRIERAVEEMQHHFAIDRDLLGFDLEADQSTMRLLDWLSSGKNVEVRMLKKRFLHGKAYLVSTNSQGVIAGSSNFTRAGLTTNAELNLGNYAPSIVATAQEWFEQHWLDAEPFDLAAIYEERYAPHSPQLIYLKMLWEWQGTEHRDEADQEAGLELTNFQQDGLWRAKRILEEYNGVLIADEVGLGKTFIAGELILEATQNRRQRALVLAPAALRDGTWDAFITEHNLNVELLSFEGLVAGNLKAKINEYSLVVVDEAHNVRSQSTLKSEALRKLLAGTPPKKLVMLTATPVNNSLWDLHNLLAYFLYNDAVFADVGIKSLRDHFAWAMKQDPDDLSPQHLFDVLDPVTVRRTRKFVKKHYPGDTITVNGEERVIEFPTPRVTRVDYDFDKALPGFFQRFADALDPDDKKTRSKKSKPPKLTLARYTPSAYFSDGKEETYEVQLAGLLRSALLKRFESSPYAFANTCETMANAHDRFLELLEQDVIATSELLADWIATDSDDTDEVENFLDGVLTNASDYDIKALKADAESDRDLLREFANTARTVKASQDPTLAVVMGELAKIAAEAEDKGLTDDDTRNRRKVLIFSYFADTVDWIYDYLAEQVESDKRLAAYRGRIAKISGTSGMSSNGTINKEDVLWGFSPKTMSAVGNRDPNDPDEDKFDIVVTTDVLAEGVNLQQAQHIINYDLPWNPMRLVQRHGRIDRIGSLHSEVFIRCVFPDKKLDDLLGLEDRIKRKLRQAAAAVGIESNVIPGEAGADRVFTQKREEIEKIRQGDAAIFEQGGTGLGTISGEELRRELAKAVDDKRLRQQIETLPWGSGSGMTAGDLTGSANTEFIFCVRVGDHKKVIFRSVVMDAEGEIVSDRDDVVAAGPADADAATAAAAINADLIIPNTLECLNKARPAQEWDTERVLSDSTQQLAYVAWSSALAEIVTSWNRLSFPKELSPSLARAQRDAIDALRGLKKLPAGQDQKSIDIAVEKLEAPLTNNRIKIIRNALKRHPDNPTEQATHLLQVIEDLGLEPYKPPQALPVIDKDDVHLVCWLALTAP